MKGDEVACPVTKMYVYVIRLRTMGLNVGLSAGHLSMGGMMQQICFGLRDMLTCDL